MDEIALLQQQLAAVQQQEAALKLSNHNVIDLLLKLQQLGKVQVIHTRSGKQFLTPSQLEREIADLVALHGGRLSLTELEQLLDVDRSYVAKHAAALCHRGGRGQRDAHFLVNSGEELLTNAYLDAIMEDTDTLLQERGTASLGALAQQFDFAVDYMREVVRSRLGSVLHAREQGNTLYTSSYVQTQKARVRGAFAAVTRPVFVPDLVRAFGFDEAVANEAVAEFVQTKVLSGMMRGREYVPFVFLAAQRESMTSFFQQNGYLEHVRARQLQVARPFDFLKKRFEDAVPLQESVVSRALQLQVEGEVEVAVNDATFVDVRALLPSALPAGDVSLLLSMSPAFSEATAGAAGPKAYQIADSYAVSAAFFNACIDKFKDDAVLKASRAAVQQKSRGVHELPSAREREHDEEDEEEDDEDFGGKRGKKSKRSKGGSKRGADESGGKASGKSRKNKKAAKRGADAGAGGHDGNSSAAGQISIVPSREDATALLTQWFPALEELQDEEEFMDGMLAHLEVQMNDVYSSALSKALSSILRGDAASLRELRKTFEDRFDEQLSRLLVLEKGFNKLAMHVDAKDPAGMEQLALVETHLLNSEAVELAALVTSFTAEAHSLELEGVPPMSSSQDGDEKKSSADIVSRLTTLSDENKKTLESSLQPPTASALVRLWTLATAGRRSLADFMAHVPVLAEALSMPLRKLDRKKERQVVFGYRQAVLADLDEQAAVQDAGNEHCALISALVLQLFFQQNTGLPASFPRETVSYASMVLQAFKPSVSEKVTKTMQTFVTLASAISSSAEPVEQQQQSEWSESLTATRALVLLKDLSAAD
ncbi:hypothetical protein BBJ28_00021014 [Nothophytophthora sp. Chile5]|nr:hypothetical protein BBJ28_00021014 [Nothophytophthora sp. Chile5]